MKPEESMTDQHEHNWVRMPQDVTSFDGIKFEDSIANLVIKEACVCGAQRIVESLGDCVRIEISPKVVQIGDLTESERQAVGEMFNGTGETPITNQVVFELRKWLAELPWTDDPQQLLALVRRAADEIERLQIVLDPRRWTQAHHEAWHRNIPDVHATFEALRNVGSPWEEGR